MTTPVFLIDASIYIFQYYFSLPDHWFSAEEQWPTAAVYGYITFLLRLLKQHQPTRIAACFDESMEQCFRNDIYPAYKSSRALPDEALAFQLNACRQITEILGVPAFASERYEADDLLGSLYQQCKRSKTPIAILTRDKDLGQLLQREQDFLWDYAKDQKAYQKDIFEKMGVHPHQVADYLALVGDSIDDIPGVPGIGKKTAQQLLGVYHSLDNVMTSVHDVPRQSIRGAAGIAQRLEEYTEQIAIAKQLATIVVDIDLIDSVVELNYQKPDRESFADFCRAMGFARLSNSI